MLTITDEASVLLATIVKQEEFPDEVAIRLVNDDQGLAMRPDSERPGDASFEHEGRTVLLLDEATSDLLSEDTLDVHENRLMLRRSQKEE
jgi:hypothetical protein